MPMNREFQPPALSTLNEDDESASLADSASLYTSNTYIVEPPKEEDIRDDLVNPHWLDDIEDTFIECTGKSGPVMILEEREHTFWKDLIKKYLLPLEDNKEKQVSTLRITIFSTSYESYKN